MEELLMRLMAQVAIVMAVGYIGARAGILSAPVRGAMSKLVGRVLLPCLMFSVISKSVSLDELRNGKPFLAASVMILLVYWGLGIGMSRLLHMKGPPREWHALLYFMDNPGFIGVPLVVSVFGHLPGAVTAYSLYFIVDCVIQWTLGYYYMTGGAYGGKISLKALLNPNFIAVLAGLAVALLHIPQHGVQGLFFDSLGSLGDCAKWMAMLYIGASLCDLKLKQCPPRLWLMIPVRLVAAPLAVYCIIRLFVKDPTQLQILTLASSLPIMMSLPTLVSASDTDRPEIIYATLLSNVACMATIPLVLWICGHIV